MPRIILLMHILPLALLAACSGGETKETELAEPTDTNGYNNEQLQETTLDLPEEWIEKEISENLEELLDVFDQPTELNNQEQALLGIDPEAYYVTIPRAERVIEMEYCTIFISDAEGGATDLYQHKVYFLSHFNRSGELTECVELSLVNEDVSTSFIQGEVIGYVSKYPAYEQGENSWTATGDTVSDHFYFMCTEKSISAINEFDKKELAYSRNRIYAHHGYIFNNKEYTDYFEQFNWYQPSLKNVDHLISANEKQYVTYLKTLEDLK